MSRSRFASSHRKESEFGVLARAALLAPIALFAVLGLGCTHSESARSPKADWPEELRSDYFAPIAMPTFEVHDQKPESPAASSATSWSLAAAEWGPVGDGGFPSPEGLTKEELRRLEEGWTVTRPFEFEAQGHDYVGGVAFQVVEAPSEDVLLALLDVEQLPHALPLTHRARLVSRSNQGDLLVEVVQGTALMRARYSVRLTRVGEHAIRFSMDRDHPHDIRDARGYFTATRFSDTHTLVTVTVGIDLGQGLARAMLKRPVQKAALSAPAHLRRYVEPRAAAAADSVVALR